MVRACTMDDDDAGTCISTYPFYLEENEKEA